MSKDTIEEVQAKNAELEEQLSSMKDIFQTVKDSNKMLDKQSLS